MNKLLYCCLTIMMLLALGCKEKEKVNSHSTYVIAGYPNEEVSIYKSEIDFWAGKNEIMKGLADENGEYYIQKNQPQPDYTPYWAKISYNGRNNYRRGEIQLANEYYKFEVDQTLTKYFRRCYASLETTPTKLQLRVFSNGMAVQGAKVYLYSSESQYVKLDNSITTEYAIVNAIPYFESTGYDVLDVGTKRTIHFYVLSDKEGIVKFPELEPKQYWFRIEKDGKSNAATKIVTDGALPDDVNITTILDVAIQ